MLKLCLFLTTIFASTFAQNFWEQIQLQAPNGFRIKDVSSKGQYLWVIGEDNILYTVDPNSNPHRLMRVPGPQNFNIQSVGATPNGWAWVITGNGIDNGPIYRITPNNQWQLMPGALVQINAISENSAVGVQKEGDIYVYMYLTDRKVYDWVKFPRGKAKCAAVGENGEIWAVGYGADYRIFRFNRNLKPLANLFSPIKGDWETMPGGAVNIDVMYGNRLISTGVDYRPYIWDVQINNWRQVDGTATKVSLSGDNYFVVDQSQRLFEEY